MANGESNGRSVTWCWLAGVAFALLVSIAGFTLAETRGDIRSLQEQKVDKDQYYNDINAINAKLDCLIKMQIDHKDR